MTLACGGLDDARPAVAIALLPVVVSHGDHCAVGLKPRRVPATCGDLDDVRPVADLALPVAVVSHGDHRAIELKPHHR